MSDNRKVVNRDQVMAYMCSLTAEYGMHPDQATARAYSQRNHSLVFPKTAISALGVSSWEEVVEIYNAEMNSVNSTRKYERSANNNGVSMPNKRRKAPRYTKEQLLDILCELWQEFDGKVTQKKICERARVKPTPSWSVFAKRFGSSETWGMQVMAHQAKVPLKAEDVPKLAEAPPTKEAPAEEPSVTESPVEAAEPAKPQEPTSKLTMELKISMPGMPAPIVMEFTIK